MPLNVPSYLDAGQVRNDLPAIICGPMLRRLTRHQVSVFAAFCVGAPVTLHVKQAGASASQSSVTVAPWRIGRHLWAAMFTIGGIDGPGSDAFVAGQVYEYWLEASAQDWPEPRRPVWGDFAIPDPNGTFYQFPTFAGLPDQLDDFTFFSASCRRLAGSRRDGFGQGMRWLSDPLVPRPHVMFLLGDQVYADEIASAFMAVLRRVAQDLIDIDEFGPGKMFRPTAEEIFQDIAHVMADGGTPKLAGRQERSTATLKMSSGAAKDHLWALEEFYAMYLLAWSDALWPAQLPDFDVGNANEIHLGLHDGDTDKHAEVWDIERHNVRNVQAALPGVRRMLANVPSLMMLDDHEVTDDWNLDLKWLRDVHGNAAGKRVMVNGLIAYLLFQHWGNDPGRFASPTGGEPASPEHRALSATTYVDQDQHPVDNAGPDDLHELVGVPVNIPAQDEDFDEANGYHMRDFAKFQNREVVRYDFRLGPADGYPAHLVFLDERTARFIPSKGRKVRAARIGISELDEMWPAPAQGFDLTLPTILIAPAPVLALDIIEDVLQPLLAFLVEEGDRDRDFENWTGHMPSYQRLLERVGEHRRVIICSGDWHFAQVKEMTYAKPADDPSPARAVQLQPCAAKFAFSLSVMLHVVGEMMTHLNMLRARTFYGYDAGPAGGLALADIARLKHSPAEHPVLPYEDVADVALGRVLRRGLEAPAVISAEVAQAYGLGAPDWQYTVAHVTDEGSPIPVALAPAMAQAAGIGTWSGWDRTKSLAMLGAQQAANIHRYGRALIGMPVMSRVWLETTGGGELVVWQELVSVHGHDENDPTHNMEIPMITQVNLGAA